MTELEKVIKGLECQYEPRMTCYGCGYFIARNKLCNKNKIFREAVDLLKAQEPMVMAYDEMMKAEICFLEVKGIEEIDPFIRYEVDDKSYWSSPYTNNADNPFELLAEQEEYLINARCWNARPTDKQREETPWPEPPKEG